MCIRDRHRDDRRVPCIAPEVEDFGGFLEVLPHPAMRVECRWVECQFLIALQPEGDHPVEGQDEHRAHQHENDARNDFLRAEAQVLVDGGAPGTRVWFFPDAGCGGCHDTYPLATSAQLTS